MMGHSTDYVKTNDGFRLFVRIFPHQTEKPQGVVHILHGMSEHSGRYVEFSEYLATKGFSVYVHDHRNHGESLRGENQLGIFKKHDTFEQLVSDAGDVQTFINEKEDTDSIITLGHSMGSMILRGLLQKHPPYLSKAIIMGTLPLYPYLMVLFMRMRTAISNIFHEVDELNKDIAKKVAASNNKGMNGSSPNAWLAKREAVIEEYEDDPKSGFTYNTMFYRHFFRYIHDVSKKQNIAKTKWVPVLFISGEDDPLAKGMRAIKNVKNIYSTKLSNTNIQLKSVDNARHEVLNETNKQETFAFLYQWMIQS